MGKPLKDRVTINGKRLWEVIDQDERFTQVAVSTILGEGKQYISNCTRRNTIDKQHIPTLCTLLGIKQEELQPVAETSVSQPSVPDTTKFQQDVGKVLLDMSAQMKAMAETLADLDATMVSTLKILQRMEERQNQMEHDLKTAHEEANRHYTAVNSQLKQLSNHVKYSSKITAA